MISGKPENVHCSNDAIRVSAESTFRSNVHANPPAARFRQVDEASNKKDSAWRPAEKAVRTSPRRPKKTLGGMRRSDSEGCMQ